MHKLVIMSAAVLTSAAAICGLSSQLAMAGDTRVAVVPGGPHPYFAPWEQAAKDAKEKFGLAATDYRVPQKWEVGEQNMVIESMLTQGYNAFLIFPGDPVGSVNAANEAVDAGAKVIASAGCLKDPSKASFCIGTDTGPAAYIGTKELIARLPGTKRILHLTGFLIDPNTQLRIDAVEQAAKEAGAEVVKVIADIDAPEPAEEKINAYLAANADSIDGIIATAWVPSVVASNALRKIGDKRIHMVAIDRDVAVIQAMKDGFVDGTMLQNSYGQIYIGAYAADKLLNGCALNEAGPWKSNALTNRFIDSGTAFVTADQADQYGAMMQSVTDTLMTDFDKNYLSCN